MTEPIFISNSKPTDKTAEEKTPTDYETLYRDQVKESERLQNVIAAGRMQSPTVTGGDDRKPGMTADRLKALMGNAAWINTPRNERLIGLGLDPSKVDDDFLKQLFGRGNDGRAALDLSKSNMYRYRQLKEASIALDIYAA